MCGRPGKPFLWTLTASLAGHWRKSNVEPHRLFVQRPESTPVAAQLNPGREGSAALLHATTGDELAPLCMVGAFPATWCLRGPAPSRHLSWNRTKLVSQRNLQVIAERINDQLVIVLLRKSGDTECANGTDPFDRNGEATACKHILVCRQTKAGLEGAIRLHLFKYDAISTLVKHSDHIEFATHPVHVRSRGAGSCGSILRFA